MKKVVNKAEDYTRDVAINLTPEEIDALRANMRSTIWKQRRKIKSMQMKKERGTIDPLKFDVEEATKDLQRYIDFESRLKKAREDIEKQVISNLQKVAKQYGTENNPKVEIMVVPKR